MIYQDHLLDIILKMTIIINVFDKWRCVFADKEYKKWDIIEICEYIHIPKKEINILKKTTINNYWFWFNWDAMILLGNGSLYNHSKNYNMIAVINNDKNSRIWFEAIKDIQIWDELVFDYGYDIKFAYVNNYAIRKVKIINKDWNSKKIILEKI